jgi:hypothetical protein
MYFGTHLTGSIDGQAGTWFIECDAYSGGVITHGPRHRERINVHYMDGQLAGYSRVQPSGRWAIYTTDGSPRPLAGFAVRRTATRWDVMRGQRRVGHTIGPDGAEAATALLTICAW